VPPDQLGALTARELKELLQVSDQTIYRMIADQTIPFLTVRNSYRFDPKQIAEWLCGAPSLALLQNPPE
jgi:excisionase family DNA binding protein